MKNLSKSICALAMLAVTETAAQQPEKPKTLKLSAVLDQEIQMEYFYNITPDCKPYGDTRIALLKAPKNGNVEIRKISVLPRFRAGNPREACNKDKVEAIAPFYKAKPGFRGSDKLTFAVVYYDGESAVHNVEITVWGP